MRSMVAALTLLACAGQQSQQRRPPAPWIEVVEVESRQIIFSGKAEAADTSDRGHIVRVGEHGTIELYGSEGALRCRMVLDGPLAQEYNIYEAQPCPVHRTSEGRYCFDGAVLTDAVRAVARRPSSVRVAGCSDLERDERIDTGVIHEENAE